MFYVVCFMTASEESECRESHCCWQIQVRVWLFFKMCLVLWVCSRALLAI